MNIFNTKKVRMAWERKIEESYNQGKKDAIDEALSSIDKSKENKKKWNELSEKELMIEIMNTLNIHNQRLEHMNDKINYILDYKIIFKEINEKIKELNECEQLLHKNIEKSQLQVNEFEENAKNIITKTEQINETLVEVAKIKSKIDNIIIDFEKFIPDLQDSCKQIDNIASNMNNTIEQYIDSPMITLYKIKKYIISIQESLNNVENGFYDLDQKIGISSDDCEYNNLNSKLEDIESKIDSSLDKFGYDSLYSKIEDLGFKLNDISDKLGNTDIKY